MSTGQDIQLQIDQLKRAIDTLSAEVGALRSDLISRQVDAPCDRSVRDELPSSE